MFKSVLMLPTLLSLTNPTPVPVSASATMVSATSVFETKSIYLSTKSMTMNDRYNNEFVNNIFKDNILLTLDYLNGIVKNKHDIEWPSIEKAKYFGMILKPNEIFAFHDQVLPEFTNNVVITTRAHFNYDDGFKSDGYITGDGVCHLASLMYWVAKVAGLTAVAPTNHDFSVINGVPREYGVAIYTWPGEFETSAKQNLYITNNLKYPVVFVFDYDGQNKLTISVRKLDGFPAGAPKL